MREALSQVKGISFRRVPHGGVENYSFLNFFLPSTQLAKEAHTALLAAGIDGCFYWFDNNWHYINGWEHLQQLKGLGELPVEVRQGMDYLQTADFSASDQWMGRNISMLVKIGWSQDDLEQRAQTASKVLEEILQKSRV